MNSVFPRLAPMLFALTCLTLSAPEPATAHGTGHRILDSTSVVVVEFIYSDNQPMRYAEVLIFSPEHDKFEYQNGRTDMNGRFAFFPPVPGQWRIQADDGTGHLERAVIDIAGDDDDPSGRDVTSRSETIGQSHSHNGLSRLWAAVLGVSLILNVFLGGYLLKKNLS